MVSTSATVAPRSWILWMASSGRRIEWSRDSCMVMVSSSVGGLLAEAYARGALDGNPCRRRIQSVAAGHADRHPRIGHRRPHQLDELLAGRARRRASWRTEPRPEGLELGQQRGVVVQH